jgi:DNA-directed RNA polymerase specialized sigma24 family protein
MMPEWCGPSSQTTDLALVLALASGDLAALGSLYDRHAAVVYGLALAMTATATDAEAVTLAVFLTLWRTGRAGRFAEQPLACWLRGAVWDAVRTPRRRGAAEPPRHEHGQPFAGPARRPAGRPQEQEPSC